MSTNIKTTRFSKCTQAAPATAATAGLNVRVLQERVYGSLDANGLTVSCNAIYKSCGQWIRSLHKLPSSSLDSLRMVRL